MKYLTTYTVRGNGSFPIDMLRYDSSFPASEVDSHAIERDGITEEGREVTVAHYSNRKGWLPTFGRWESFGWRVKKGSVEVKKR